MFYCKFYFTCDRSLKVGAYESGSPGSWSGHGGVTEQCRNTRDVGPTDIRLKTVVTLYDDRVGC